jgi:hypothetical protein
MLTHVECDRIIKRASRTLVTPCLVRPLPLVPVVAVLGGRLPASFARLTNLRMLMLEHNYLTGTLPNLCSSLKQLEVSSA